MREDSDSPYLQDTEEPQHERKACFEKNLPEVQNPKFYLHLLLRLQCNLGSNFEYHL